MLALEIELLTGRYAAARHNDRDRAEWPPHPGRVYAALVATHHDSEQPDPEERAALIWLAAQAPPAIACSPAAERTVRPVFVPVNDTSLFANLGDKELALEAARAAAAEVGNQPGDLKAATKAVDKAEKALVKAWDKERKAALEPGKLTATAVKDGAGLLPERRLRKERTFPVAIPERAHVHLVWPEAEPDEAHRSALARLCERVVRIGHSSSLVRVSLTDLPPEPDWGPDPRGELSLRVPREGQLALLERAFEQHRETEPRILPFEFVAYGRGRSTGRVEAAAPHLSGDWVVFRRVGGHRLDLSAAVAMAEALRGALQAHASEPVHPALSGHHPDGRVLDRPHVAFVPLPHVGWPHADGTLLGIAVLLPRGLDEEGRTAVYRAIGTWERAAAAAGEALSLKMGRTGALTVERIQGAPESRALERATWCRPARLWVTATPVALDRHPGPLFHSDPAKADAAEAQAEQSLVQACLNVGLPAPSRVRILRSELLRGSRPARDFPPFPPREKAGARRMLVHARLRFDEPVEGPLVLGAGRYRGLGLFRPVREADR